MLLHRLTHGLANPLSWPDETRDEALAAMAVGVLTVDSAGDVRFASPSCLDLLPLVLPGHNLRRLLSLWGISNGSELAAATEARVASEPIRLGLSDGRILDARSRPLERGGAVVTLLDVTPYIREAELAQRDALTGLANRAGLYNRLEELLDGAQRNEACLSVICLDLDRFKAVNDTLGHPAGDALLVKVAERLRVAVRKTDFLARVGGDEFVILQAGVPQPQAAEALAKRLVDLIGRTYVVADHMVNVGASVGVAISPGDGSSADTLMKHADLALYRAKSDGRGVFRFFQTSMNDDMQTRRNLEIDLRKALAMKEFELAYQPKIQLNTRRVVGFEALLRWRHPERGFVSPGEFIPLAEEIGLIAPIGEWVMRTACREAASWPGEISIAVNVSAFQFRDSKLVEVVQAALTASGLRPSLLELEITESALIDNTERVLTVLRELKVMGVQLAMDDFGTGYSSLSYLQKFPFDTIKIDGSFVRGADPDSGAIVRAVAALGASLGMKTIAEGVETSQQLEQVQAHGCHEVQGYFTGRPLPASATLGLLNEQNRTNN